ncbi:MAG: ParB/RepB/Spo0J family partition protein [Pyrinomonadaceae bacterium]
MTRKVLGRGLSALLTMPNEETDNEFLEVEIGDVQPNRSQPRTNFDAARLNELAESIKANGIVQPLLVRRVAAGGYQIVAGERRWRAAQIAGMFKIPVVVREIDDEKMLELALIENIQRQELNAIEEAHAYKNLIDVLGLTQDVVAQRVGKDRTVITNHLRLLRLPDEVQKLVENGQLTMGHARALLGVDDAEFQKRLARRVIEKNLSVREVERTISAINGNKTTRGRQQTESKPANDANFRAAEDKLRRKLGTQVRIVQGRESAGKIEIEYYSQRDLTRIYDLLFGQDTAIQHAGN